MASAGSVDSKGNLGQPVCVFCGSAGPLTREHVFGRWLAEIGLDSALVRQVAAPLNGLGREMGVTPPFRATVREVCAVCNNGWMSDLESAAQRVLTPFILGGAGTMTAADRAAVAVWAHKTALVAMLLSSAEERRRGHGVPAAEYGVVRISARAGEIAPNTAVWIGCYSGRFRSGMTRVVPMIARGRALPEPTAPDGYLFTVVVGELLVQGMRFTNGGGGVPLHASGSWLKELVPRHSRTGLRPTEVLDDDQLLSAAAGSLLRPLARGVELVPWSPASDLPQSRAVGSLVELPLLCQQHVAYYPAWLVAEARRRHFYWFTVGCGCGLAYLVRTEETGAHAKAADAPEVIARRFDSLPGRVVRHSMDGQSIACKRAHLGAAFSRQL